MWYIFSAYARDHSCWCVQLRFTDFFSRLHFMIPTGFYLFACPQIYFHTFIFFAAAVNFVYMCKKHSWGHKQRNGISSHRICTLSTLLDNSGLLTHVPLGNLLNYALNFTGQLWFCGFVLVLFFFCVGFYCSLGGFWWVKWFMNSPICLSFYWHIVIHKQLFS